MAWPETRVANWNRFVEVVTRLQLGAPPTATYIFRGQPCSKFSLQPTLQRKVNSLNRDETIRVEKLLLAEFQSQAHLLLQESRLPDYEDTISWWTLMQHHGAPTRLLDWTKSPYVAAYFAVESESDQDGVLWYFHTNRLEVRMRTLGYPAFDEAIGKKELPILFLKPSDLQCCYLFERKRKIERMVTQQGGFTISPDVLADHAEIIERALVKNDGEELFRKVISPAELKAEFLLQLHRLNVNGIALFPGIDGLGRSLKEFATLQVLKSVPPKRE